MICGHGFDKPSQCVDCMLDGPVLPARRAEWEEVGEPINAQFPGPECTCGRSIEMGVRIQRWDIPGVRTTYRHVGCAP